jgi:lipoprotein-anchoring transpeptidase ErfK/SrfK
MKTRAYGSRQYAEKWRLLALLAVFAARAFAQSQGAANLRSHREVLVSIADRQLAVLEDGQIIRIFPVAVGASISPSPTGDFQIVNRVTNPTYYHPGVVISAGNDNPIGPRWIGLDRKGYGIHGTNEPRSIGKAASHGCLRMRNRDIRQFFTLVRVGDVVRIRGERDSEVSQVFGDPVGASVVAESQTTALQAGGGQ